MHVKSNFTKLCAAMNQQLVPVLNSAGFSSSETPFRREAVRYEFRRGRSEGVEVVAVLFNRKREALFSVQLYVEPLEGVPAFLGAGGQLYGNPERGKDLVADGRNCFPRRSHVFRPLQRASNHRFGAPHPAVCSTAATC